MPSAFDVVTVVISLGAASLSLLAIRVGRNANQLPIVIDLLEKSRDAAFMLKEEALYEQLRHRDPAEGFEKLPPEIRADVFEVAHYYQCLAYLAVHSIADFWFIAPQVSYRATRTWNAIEAHVHGERDLRGGAHTFFNTYEIFVDGMKQMDLQALDEAAERRSRRWARRERRIVRWFRR